MATSAHSDLALRFGRFRSRPILWVVPGLPVGALAGLTTATSPITGLSVAVAALTLFVGIIVAAFSARYMRSDDGRTRFFILLGCLVGSVLLFVLTTHVVVFAAGWIASGILLAQLVGHSRSLGEARAAARRSLRSFLLGDAAALLAVAWLCWHAHSWQLDAAIAGRASMSALDGTLIAFLLLIAAAARCALPPFSGWLLSSMTAPTPVSALMHAGFVNAGGFLLLRFAPLLEAAPAVRYATVAVGAVAALWGIGVMIVRPDLKRSLAGSTVSQMGFMIMSCGLGAYVAALWHLVAHGLFKAWLFLNAGSAVGIRESRRPALEPRLVIVAAALAFITAYILTLDGSLGADAIPLLLATATGVATFGAIAISDGRAKSRLILSGVLAGLVGVYVLGFAAVSLVFPRAEAALLTPRASTVLLAVFLACWAWQSFQIGRQRPLPAALYVRLLNAGALDPVTTGDRP